MTTVGVQVAFVVGRQNMSIRKLSEMVSLESVIVWTLAIAVYNLVKVGWPWKETSTPWHCTRTLICRLELKM